MKTYNESHIAQIPWNNLVHFEGRSINIPLLLQVYQHGDERESRIALAELCNLVEREYQLNSIAPIVLYYFSDQIKNDLKNRDLLLLLYLRIAKVVAYNWEKYRKLNLEDLHLEIDAIWQINSPFLVADEIEIPNGDTRNVVIHTDKMNQILWVLCNDLLLNAKKAIENLKNTTDHENGFIYEILTILKMIKPQARKIIPANFKRETDLVCLRSISLADSENVTTHLQGETAQYLSFDPKGNKKIINFYIQQSIQEQIAGNALVLIIENKNTGEFLGSCSLNDINNESIEIGIWLKQEAQGKGIGKHVVSEVIKLIKENIDTKYILYNVEQNNEKSHAIPLGLLFEKTNTFILAPTTLKNTFRNMVEYRKYI